MMRRISKNLSGVAGEYFVAGELSKLGYIATITLRNTRGVDILVAGRDASHSVGIQVKTNQGNSKGWVLTKKAESLAEDGLFYVFVNLNGVDGSPSYHVVPSSHVAKWIRDNHRAWLAGSRKDGRQRKDTSMRKFWDREEEWKGRWELLGLEPIVD